MAAISVRWWRWGCGPPLHAPRLHGRPTRRDAGCHGGCLRRRRRCPRGRRGLAFSCVVLAAARVSVAVLSYVAYGHGRLALAGPAVAARSLMRSAADPVRVAVLVEQQGADETEAPSGTLWSGSGVGAAV